MNTLVPPPFNVPVPRWLRWSAFGFAYWCLFLLLLEPGNLARARMDGYNLPWGHESLRILGAALIGALVAPLTWRVNERFPLLEPSSIRQRVLHIACASAMAAGLILVSCVLAAWGFSGTWLPSAAVICQQLADNWLLLVYALLAQAALAHGLGQRRGMASMPDASGDASPHSILAQVTIKTRGRQSQVALNQVGWIETQGNYLALHVGTRVHLLRQTLADFETRLDPQRFVRVHRRALVAIDQVRDMKPLTNGDAELRLLDGQTVRVSRSYRKRFEAAWSALV